MQMDVKPVLKYILKLFLNYYNISNLKHNQMSKPKTITITVTESGEKNIDISVNCTLDLNVMDMIRVVDSVSEVNVKKLKEYAAVNEITDMDIINKVTFNDLKS